MTTQDQPIRLHEYLGPGLLFAASSVGVSHIIQSTRAGATFGLSLVLLTIVINVLKFAPLSFGPRYSLATGVSLLQGYRNRSRFAIIGFSWVAILLAAVTVPAIAFITIAVCKAIVGVALPAILPNALLLAACGLLVGFGGYQVLEKIVRVLVAVFSVLTLAATIAAFGDLPAGWNQLRLWPTDLSVSQYFFIIAFLGWMPTTMDASVWQSQWALEKYAGRRAVVDLAVIAREFLAGYVGTIVLAVCFIVLGYSTVSATGEPLSASASVFVSQILQAYATAIGPWSVPLVGLCVISVLLSTLLTIIDAYPRTIVLSIQRWSHDEVPDREAPTSRSTIFRMTVGALCVYTLIVVTWFDASFTVLIDIATTTSFLLAPFVALLNHLAMHGAEVPVVERPGRAMSTLSIMNIVALVGLAVAYLSFVLR